MCLPGMHNLTEEEREVLRFVLDSTIERWTDDNEEQLRHVADDRTIGDIDRLLEVTNSLSGLPRLVDSIRNKLFLMEAETSV